MDPIAAHAHLTALAGLHFQKLHATGNDFVILSDPDDERDVGPDQVAALCDRHLGIGGDGLIRAVRSQHIPEGRDLLARDEHAEWFMDYRNGDGSVAEMCGNGVRAYAHFLELNGLAEIPEDGLHIGTRAGVKIVKRTGDGYSVDMGVWRYLHPEKAAESAMDSLVSTAGLDVARPSLSVDMGNPHTVVAVANDAELVKLDLSKIPEVEPTPANGINVEYVLPSDPLVEDHVAMISMRVHERGVGETLSCGTGICAAVVATRTWAGAAGDAAAAWAVQVPGGVCGVRFRMASDGEHVILSGPAVRVATGTLG
jgi:diaminopimelate epimerase